MILKLRGDLLSLDTHCDAFSEGKALATGYFEFV